MSCDTSWSRTGGSSWPTSHIVLQESEVEHFTHHLNSMDENIKFTAEPEQDNGGAIAYRLEGWTLNRENPVSNPTAVASNLWQV